MQVLGLIWLGTRTDRFAEMTAFAENVLGLAPGHVEDGLRFYDLADGAGFEVFDPEHDGGGHPARGAVGGFLVADVEAAHAELVAAGVGVTPLASGQQHRWAYFRAPDGCVYEIVGDA